MSRLKILPNILFYLMSILQNSCSGTMTKRVIEMIILEYDNYPKLMFQSAPIVNNFFLLFHIFFF